MGVTVHIDEVVLHGVDARSLEHELVEELARALAPAMPNPRDVRAVAHAIAREVRRAVEK